MNGNISRADFLAALVVLPALPRVWPDDPYTHAEPSGFPLDLRPASDEAVGVPDGIVRFEVMAGPRVLASRDVRYRWEGVRVVAGEDPGTLEVVVAEPVEVTGYRWRTADHVIAETFVDIALAAGATLSADLPKVLVEPV